MTAPFAMEMADGGGILTLRDAEPYEIQTPTAITGTYDGPDEEAGDPGTGTITAGTFSTPEVSLTQDITSPLVATVYIDAAFSQVTPGNLVGTVDVDGNVFVRTALTVDLHIDVGRNPTFLSADCRSTPIELALASTVPLDPATGLVTLANDDFSIPAVPYGSGCNELVGSAVNDQLAGGGHAISLTVQTDLQPPADPGEPVDVALAVSPEGGVQAGEPVTLSATVVPGEGAGETTVPTGDVEILRGNQVVASGPLDDTGAVEIVTSSLPAGSHELRARYRGDEVYGPALSAPIPYTVFAHPALSWDLPSHIQVAGDPVELTLTAANTGWGQDLAHVRMDITITRERGSGDLKPNPFGEDRVTLAHVVDGTETPIPLAVESISARDYLKATIGAATGTPLAPGTSLAEHLRLAFPPAGSGTVNCVTGLTCPGPLLITVDLVQVDPTSGEVLATVASSTGRTTLIEAARRATTMTAGNDGLYVEGLGWLVPPTPAIAPHTVRAGSPITLNSLTLEPRPGLIGPGGTVSFFLDGRPIGGLARGASPTAGYRTEVPVANGFVVPVPADTGAGTHTLTVRYNGDDLFLPTQESWTFEVAPNLAPPYECEAPSLLNHYVGGGNLVAQGTLPPVVAAGTDVTVVNPVLRLLLDRGPSTDTIANGHLGGVAGGTGEMEVDFGGLAATASTSGITRTNSTRMDEPGDPDQVLEVQDPTLTVVVDGAPGEVVPIIIDSLVFPYGTDGNRVSCTPMGDPVVLGHVTVAGTTLEVAPGGPVRTGTPVTLTATTAPATDGFVEFRDGTTTVGVAALSEGRAVITTTALPAGELSLTARTFGGLSVPVTTSEAVPLTVVPTECEAFAVDGHGATVRLVYLELLGRCPDQVGFDYWTGRLGAGTSPEAFARAIAATPEAVGQVVEDAYRTMLGRSADARGQAFWVERMTAGADRYDQLLADLGASEEFWARSGSNDDGFVIRVYEQLLQRAPDADGLTYWVGRLDTGVSRRVLIRTLANLDEPLGVLATGSYDEILGRAPTSTERSGAITHLRATGDRSGLYAELIGRPEFATRAQSFPNPGE